MAGVSSTGKGDIWEVAGVEGEPNRGCHESGVIVVRVAIVAGLLLDLSLESGDLGLE